MLHFLLELLFLLKLLVYVPSGVILMESLEQVLDVFISPAFLIDFGLESAFLFFLHLFKDSRNLHVVVLIALHELFNGLLFAGPSYLPGLIADITCPHLSHLSILLLGHWDDFLAQCV